MKIFKLVSILLILIISSLSVSCTTNVEPIDPAVLNPNINPNAPVAGAFKVDFSDQTYTTTDATAVITGTTITIAALNTSGKNFTINLTGIAPGNYSTIDKVSILYKKQVSDIFGYVSSNSLGSTATVSVTSINDVTRRIKGTFKFIGNWNDPSNTTPPVGIQFTNGTFDVPFTTPNVPTNVTFFKVDFNGQTFNTNTTTAILTNGQIIINASKGLNQQETFSIALKGNRLGDFTSVDDVINYVVANPDDYGYVNYTSTLTTNTGKVTITQIDTVNKTISGTFNYMGNWSDFSNLNPPAPIEFTNGSFKIPYTESVVSSDTFFAKVNEVEFVESFIATALVTVNNVDVISINATNSVDDRISISIDDTFTVGNTYSAVNEAKCSLKEDGVVSFANAGTVKILSKTNTKISGIFSFTTASGRTVTEGTFDVGY